MDNWTIVSPILWYWLPDRRCLPRFFNTRAAPPLRTIAGNGERQAQVALNHDAEDGLVVADSRTSPLNPGRDVIRGVPSFGGECLLRDRGRSQFGCQNRQFADLFPLHGTAEVGGVIHHPNLRNDFTDEFSMTEKPHH